MGRAVDRHTILDNISECIIELSYAIANDFEGIGHSSWSPAREVVGRVFERFGEQPDGVDPQQQIAIKVIEKVKENMVGFYPAVTRVRISVIGPSHDRKPSSAFSLLRRAFYSEVVRLPDLYERNPEKASEYLPKDVRYDAEKAAVVKIYRDGEGKPTELRALRVEPVSFESIRRTARVGEGGSPAG